MSGLRLTVIGAGYLGLTHAACMASLGFRVLAVDTDRARITALAAGRVPISEPGLNDLVQAGMATGRLAFTTSYDQAAGHGDVHFICTGTPGIPGQGQADLSQVTAAVTTLAERVTRPCLIAGKSTVPVGTARKLAALAGPLAEVAWNPEFLCEGTAVADTLRPARIVAGVTSGEAMRLLRHVYAEPVAAGTPFHVTTPETAELSKLAANAYLATRVSFINAMAEICEATGADVRTLAGILGADPRIGAAYLQPGLGFGGGCLPKDLLALVAQAEDLGAGQAAGLLDAAGRVNARARARVLELTVGLAGGNVAGVRVCVLGAAFKAGTDDVRDSPALHVARNLRWMGAQVTVCDPAAVANARRVCPDLAYTEDPARAAYGADLVVLLTGWPEYARLDPSEFGQLVRVRRIIDGRNVLNPVLWRSAGWEYSAPGAEPRDGALQAVAEANGGFPAEEVTGQADIRAADHRVVLRPARERDLRTGAGHVTDDPG